MMDFIGTSNDAHGTYALSGLIEGYENIGIGRDAGSKVKYGNRNIYIGRYSNSVDTTITNGIAIGFMAEVAQSNSMVLGGTGSNAVNVGIGVNAPARAIHVNAVMRLEPKTTAPSAPAKGDMYFDGTLNKLRVYDGTSWDRRTKDTSFWSINGNQNLNDSSFIGTTDTFILKYKVNNVHSGFIDYKHSNTAFGYNSLKSAQSGNKNTSIGVNNLNNCTTGSYNIGIGYNNLSSITTAGGNIAIGNNSQYKSKLAVGNISLGHNTLRDNKLVNGNVAIGNNVLTYFDFPVHLAGYNTAVGEGSMGYVTTGYRNNGFGAYSLHYLKTGQQNTAVGIDAGQSLINGDFNVFLGNNTDVSDSSISNSVAIGYGAVVGSSNAIVLGDTTNSKLNVGIGIASPKRKLHIKSVMRLEPLNSAPSSPARGDMYFDGTLNKLRVYDGTAWQNCW